MKSEPIELPASINNTDHGGGLRDEDITIELWDAYGDGWNGNVLTLHCDTHGTDVLFSLIGDGYYDDGSYVSYTLPLHDGSFGVSCDGGSWQSEVSWVITHTSSGQQILAGGAPYSGGSFSIPFVAGTNPGCTDTDALNYGYNCAGEEVGIPDADDGCCEYPTPSNDDCVDAEPVTSYPTEITSSSENATIDCEGYLNWNAVWYELALPYDYNLVDIVLQAAGPITNGGIVVMDDCNCDDFIGMTYEFDPAAGYLHLMGSGIPGPDNNGTILYPLFIDPQQGYTVTFNVIEEIWGCTDPNATNYNPDATNDDGSCTYDDCTTTHDLRMFMYDAWGDGWNGNVYTISDLASGEVL